MQTCLSNDCFSSIENPDTGLCAACGRALRKSQEPKKEKKYQRIRQASKKKTGEIKEYIEVKKRFLNNPENKLCCVCNRPGVDSIHHAKGKEGYSDEMEIPLLIDERFFKPIHSFILYPTYGISCHQWVEEHPEEAKRLGYSNSRLETDKTND